MVTSPSKRRPLPDPTVYPDEDDVGEGSLQRFIAELLRMQLEHYLNTVRGERLFVGADQFIYYRQYNPFKRVSPDIYVLRGQPPGRAVSSWKTWLDEFVPTFALEIVSQNWHKDYATNVPAYEEIGVPELIVVDPEYTNAPDDRVLWQVFRRKPRSRELVRVARTNDDRVHSGALGCWLRTVGDDPDTLRVRVATGPGGEQLLPTPDELAAEAATRAAEAATRAAEANARADEALRLLEAERKEREKLSAELARLRARAPRRPKR